MTYGALKPKIDLRDNRLAAASSVEFPSSFEISWLPEVKNQANCNSCVAHSSSSILEFFEKLEHGEEVSLSTDFIYGMQDRTGQGMYLRDACKIVQKYGDTFKSTFPNNTEQPTCGEKVKAKVAADASILEEADYFKINSYVSCKTNAEKKTAIYAERPLLGCIKWYDKYSMKDGVITFDTSSNYGYHAIMVYGWNETGWLCQNSWGSSWGNKGRFILPYSSGLEEAWAFTDAERAPAKGKTANFFIKLLNRIINFFLGR